MAKKTTPNKAETEIITKGGIQWSIYPDRKSGKWMLYARVAGERILRCRATKKGAEDAISSELQKLKEKGFSESVNLFGPQAGDYQLAIQVLNKFDNVSLLQAASYYAANHQYATIRILTQKAVDEYKLEKSNAELSDVHIRAIKYRLGNFCDKFGSKYLMEITNSDLTQWLAIYKGKTRNNHRSEVSCFFLWAQNKGYLKEGKTAAYKLQKAREESSAPYIATKAQFDCMLKIANSITDKRRKQNALVFLALAFLTGIRSAEMSRLTWKNVFQNHITIGKEDAKTMTRRLVPICPALSKILEPIRGEPHEKLVDMSHFQSALTNEIRLARTKDESIAALLPHKFPNNFGRHTWTSYCVAWNSDVAKTSLYAGNSPKKIFENYLSITMSDGNVITEALAKDYFGYTSPKQEKVISK